MNVQFAELVLANRSYRRFQAEAELTRQELSELVALARLTASARNLQPLKYLLACEPERNALIFDHLTWAGYLPEWPGPAVGERPTGYIVMLGDTRLAADFAIDCGIAAQTILLAATSRGLGGCLIGSIKREKLQKALPVPTYCQILLVVALGKPREKVVVEEVGADGKIEYWRDAQGVHHVPKRPLTEIILA
jgi:nitroreductase